MTRIVTLAALLAAVGCQSSGRARYVARHSESGIVAISSNTTGERDKGLALIARHVGPQFVIDREEVIMLSDDTHRGRDRSVRPNANPTKSVNPQDLFAIETTPRSEHHIFYRRSTPMNAPPTMPEATAAPTADKTMVPASTSAVVPASASIPVSPSVPSRETTAAPVSMRSFLPLTCEGCQGR